MPRTYGLLALAASLSLTACATAPRRATPEPHPVLAITARVAERQYVPRSPATNQFPPATAQVPTSAGGALSGALGVLAASAIGSAILGKPGYWAYTIRAADGSTRKLTVSEEYEMGACLAIFTTADMADFAWWSMSELTVQRADDCG